MVYNPRVSNGTRYRRERAKVLREEDTCALCGQWVDKSLPKDDPMAPVVDHVVTLYEGGPVQGRANKQLAHRACNRAKGKGTPRAVSAPHPPTSQAW